MQATTNTSSTATTKAAEAQRQAQDGELTDAQLGRDTRALATADWSWDKSGAHKRAALDILMLRARTGKDSADRSIYNLGEELGQVVPKSTAARQLAELVRRGLLERREPEQRYDPSTGRRDAPSYRNLSEAITVLLTSKPRGMGQARGTGPTSTNRGSVGQALGRHQKKETSSPSVQSAVGSGEPPSRPEGEEGNQAQQPPAGAGRSRRNLAPGRATSSASGNANARKRESERPRRSERSERRSVPVVAPHIAQWLGRVSDGRDAKRLRVLTALDAETRRQYGRPATEEEQIQALVRAGLMVSRRQPRGRTA